MTFFETAGQARAFLWLLYAGMGAGLCYDLLSPLRRRLPSLPAAGIDALWALAAGALCALALFQGGANRLRLYALLGLGLGGGVYALGIHALGKAVIRRFTGRKSRAARRIASPSDQEGGSPCAGE